jgi:uncharacterized radical SAM protein YgiQ
MNEYLPLSRAEMYARGWDQLDFIMVSGDAYVDHPSFGATLIARLLESEGYRVGFICQPDWRNPEAFKVLGKPRLAFLVSGGNMDSMVLHFSVNKKRRREDLYTPNKEAGKRPDRAVIVYSAAIRQAYKKVPIIIGGVETSLRRLAHYDYWQNSLRRSILLDAKADIAVWGMGERAIIELASRLAAGHDIRTIRDIPGTVFKVNQDEIPEQAVILPSFEQISLDKLEFARSFGIQNRNTDAFSAKPLAEIYSRGEVVVQMPPSMPLNQELFDRVYELPYQRRPHPAFQVPGTPGCGIAALEEVQFSLVSNRGCFGGCSFCALTFHQGRYVAARCRESLVREATLLTQHPDFKGYIHDVGGPTANFRGPSCKKMATHGACLDRNCLGTNPCKHLKADHSDYLKLLKTLRTIPGVKKVFVRSGIRFDYLLEDANTDFFRELVQHHISGQLKVAPEHVSPRVLAAMGKPSIQVYKDFKLRYQDWNKKAGKKQFLVPYFISSHPGSTLEDAIDLALFIRDQGVQPQQVQDFYPTPGTISTCMFYSGFDPRTLQPIHTASDPKEKAMQRALLQFKDPKNHSLVLQALELTGRQDLIGNKPGCLVPQGRGKTTNQSVGNGSVNSRNRKKPGRIKQTRQNHGY